MRARIQLSHISFAAMAFSLSLVFLAGCNNASSSPSGGPKVDLPEGPRAAAVGPALGASVGSSVSSVGSPPGSVVGAAVGTGVRLVVVRP